MKAFFIILALALVLGASVGLFLFNFRVTRRDSGQRAFRDEDPLRERHGKLS